MLSKDCLQCGEMFSKPYGESKKAWKERHKFCSRKCVNLFQKGKPLKHIDYSTRIPWNKGKKYPAITGEKHHFWKGDNVGYVNLHTWVYRHKGRPNKCEMCGTTEKRKYHWANKSKRYKRELDDWIRLCVPCHKKKDAHSS